MTKPNFIFKIIALSVFCFLSSNSAFAQAVSKTSVEPSYEVMLQVLVGSNSAEQKSVLSGNLSALTKNLRNRVSFANFNLTSTSLQRVANYGNLQIKNVFGGGSENSTAGTPVFSEWSIGQLQTSTADAVSRNSFQITNFRFGQRVPVRLAGGAVNYEQVGLSLEKLNLPEGVPTVIGSFSTEKPDEMMFLVLTVKRAEN